MIKSMQSKNQMIHREPTNKRQQSKLRFYSTYPHKKSKLFLKASFCSTYTVCLENILYIIKMSNNKNHEVQQFNDNLGNLMSGKVIGSGTELLLQLSPLNKL